jgi:hypothetical protein
VRALLDWIDDSYQLLIRGVVSTPPNDRQDERPATSTTVQVKLVGTANRPADRVVREALADDARRARRGEDICCFRHYL